MTSVGVSPVGTRYNVAGIVTLEPVTNKRIARSVVWETGDPIAWGRYARIGLGQGNEPVGGLGINSKVQAVKLEVAKSLNADWKHPAPATIDAPGASAIGVLGGWTQSIAAYVGSGVLLPQPGVVILAGWPEFGSVLPAGNPGGFAEFGTCHVEKAYCLGPSDPYGPHHDLCLNSSFTEFDGACPAGETTLRQFAHCNNSGVVVGVPEIGGVLTYGQSTIYNSEPAITQNDINHCIAVLGNPELCDSMAVQFNANFPHDYIEYGNITINSVQVSTYQCNVVSAGVSYNSNDGYYTMYNNGHFPRKQDALCCLPPAQ